MSSLPLDYSHIKRFQNTREGMNVNPFFGKWQTLNAFPADLMMYRYAIDTIRNRVYHHPMVTTGTLTAPANCYFYEGKELSFDVIRSAMTATKDVAYVSADTVDGPYLVVATPEVAANDVALAAAAYKTYTAKTIAAATRPVEDSDRHIHWVWFRKPGYKLTEEIALRAASWIEMNQNPPSYHFHLWSSLQDAAELEDFLGDLTAETKSRYFDSGAITVHYAQEFYDVVFTWMQANCPELVEAFDEVWHSRERQDIVMKTDYSRNILLAVFGGIYTDFNDLLCLVPIEPLLEAHAGSCVGVTDNASDSNASNYFMYAAKGNAHWNDITVQCTRKMPEVRTAIYDPVVMQTARDSLEAIANGQAPNPTRCRAAMITPFYRQMDEKFFYYSLCFCAINLLPDTAAAKQSLQDLLWRSQHGRIKPTFITEMIQRLAPSRDEFLTLLKTPAFEPQWRFARTDIYLNPIMHRTNLPIFCREQKLPLYLVPFGYLLRYACLLSFVGHLGDATSYGMDPQKKTTIRRLTGSE